jgi:hypothetical protein
MHRLLLVQLQHVVDDSPIEILSTQMRVATDEQYITGLAF